MLGQLLDPAARRLRRDLLLVLLGVALPSLLLTGFGLIAIANERDAATQRVREVYRPVARGLASRLEAHLEALVADSRDPLEDLVRWSRRDTAQPGERFTRFIAAAPAAANFFVLEAADVPATPRPAGPGFTLRGSPAALAGRCAERADACRRIASGTPGDLQAAEDSLLAGCGRFVDRVGYHPALGVALHRLIRLAEAGGAGAVEAAVRLADLLADPTLPADPAQVRFTARRAADPLGRIAATAAAPARARIAATAAGLDVSSQRARLAAMAADAPGLHALVIDGRARILVMAGERAAAGFEVVPAALEALANQLRDEMGVTEELRLALRNHREDRPLDATVSPGASAPIKGLPGWRLELSLTGATSLDQLTSSRSRLYVWILASLVVVLILGIARTVQVMIREARISRLKTDFVSSVSHELRTPLTSIRMFTETLLLDRVRGEDQARECLETIGQESERLSRLVERILDFARMEAGRKAYRFELQQPRALAEAAVAACQPMADEGGFRVVLDVDAGLPLVSADRDALVEVLVNLLSNAIKYSGENREVTVRARLAGERLALEVEDRGVGIPRSEQHRIFEKFYRIDQPLTGKVAGSGLGLSLIAHIVEAHGGEVTVTSTPGRGSTFTVLLPLGQEAQDA